MMKAIFALMGAGLFLAAIAMEGDIWSFVNAPSLLIVLGATFCLSLAHHTPDELLAAFKAAFGREAMNAEQSMAQMAVLSTVRMIAIASGVVGFLIGVVLMLQNLDDPKQIGPAMAVSLLTLFYAMILSECVLGPLSNRVAIGIKGQGGEALKVASASTVLVLISVLGVISAFGLCMFCISPIA
jgi:flagellar motor component MotA